MIPKVIHYCWFGGNEKPAAVVKCIESWKKYCPDYEITEWNESNFDVQCIPFVKGAYAAKKWAFVSDYARLKIVYENGGIYLDTDVELIKPIDSFLSFEGFAGFEGESFVATGLGFGAVKGQKLIYELMIDYHNRAFPENEEGLTNIACPIINTEVFERNGLIRNGALQTVMGVQVFPKDYFNPKDSETYITDITENTVSIHHYDATWKSGPSGLKQKVIKLLVKLMGKKGFLKFKEMMKR